MSRLALGLVLLPFAVGALVLIFAVRDSYLPISDHALTELHIRDIGHHQVLTGLYSREDWSHPGPMLFYILAPFYWLTGGASIGMNLGALAINAASITGLALIARRRGGTTLMLCTLLASALLMRTLSADFLRDPWNNYITVFPYGLLIFLVWSMVCGDRWALPAGVVVASYLAQTHVGFVVEAVPLLLFGAVWLTVATVRQGDHDARVRIAKAGALSVVIGAVLWLPVAIDTIVHHPSNLSRISRYFRESDERMHTFAEGWRVISGQFAAAPEWLTTKKPWLIFTAESPFLNHAPFPFLLVLVVAAAVGFWRLRKGDGLRLVLTLAVAFVLGVIAIDRTLGSALDYRLRWTWMPGMFGFVIVTWCAALALTKRWPDATRRVVPVVVVIGLVALSAVNVTTALRAGTPQRADGDVVEALLPAILDDLARDPNSRHGQVVIDDGPVLLALSYSRAMVLQLERRGYDARMPQPFGVIVGQHRQEDDGPVAEHLVFAMDWEIVQRDADPGLHQVAKWSSATPEQERTYHEQAAKIDEAFANGQMSELDHVIALKRIDLGELDPATAWAVAVYRADPQLSG